MKIDIHGDEELIKKLESMVDSQKIEMALGKACALVERAAKENAPKGTGELRRSITSKVEGEEGVVFTPLEYAPYVEYGTGLFAESGGRTDVPWVYKDDEGHWHTTSGQKPQPYLRPALHENRKKIVEIIKEGLLND
jgi:HK97 gp10 family phage protein